MGDESIRHSYACVNSAADASRGGACAGVFARFRDRRQRLDNQGNGSITRVPSGFSTGGGYADAIDSAQGNDHARLHVDPAANFGNAGDPSCAPGSKDCIGPYTDWGLSFSAGRFPTGGVSTSADIYLDTAFAATHKDYRFDWDSALNDSTGQFLQDYVFNVGTATPNDPRIESGVASGNSHFVIAASTNALRESSSPEDPNHNPQCITASDGTRSNMYSSPTRMAILKST